MKPRLFLSYNIHDCLIADIVERELSHVTNNGISISRYNRDVEYKNSFKEFMNSIEKHNFVLCIVSDYYLKSQACMYEVGEVIKNHNYNKKLLFVVLNDEDNKFIPDSSCQIVAADIYDAIKRAEYIRFWHDKCVYLEKSIAEIDNIAGRESLDDLYVIKKIYKNDIGEFLKYLSDSKGKSFEELYTDHFIDIIKWIFPKWNSKKFANCADYSELFKNAIEEIFKITRTDYNQIALTVKTSSYQHGLVVFADSISNMKQRYGLVAVDGLMSKVVSSGRLCNVLNVKTDNDYFNAVPETESELVVPIKIDGNTIGVINSEAEVENYYSNKVIQRIKKISDDFSVALIRLGYSSNISINQLPYVHVEL